MEITVCETAGLCLGATTAINSVKSLLEKNKNVVMYKEILHNEEVVNLLKRDGAKIVDNINKVGKNDITVLRAHGEELFVYEYLKNNKLKWIDTICVNVKRVHDIALKKQNAGYKIIVVGKINNGIYHDEVKALITYLDSPIILTNEEDANNFNFNNNLKYFLVVQTTFSLNLFNNIVSLLNDKAKKNNIDFQYCDTICRVPIVNIDKSKKLAKESNIALVLGSRTSSNTNELVSEIKKEVFTLFSNNENELIDGVINYINIYNCDLENFKICILAGASTLKEKLQNLKTKLEKRLKSI